MEKFFLYVYNYFEKHRLVFFCTFLSSFLLIGWFASKIRFEEDISKVLPKDKKIEKLSQVFQNSKFLDRLVVMVSRKIPSRRHNPTAWWIMRIIMWKPFSKKQGPLSGK